MELLQVLALAALPALGNFTGGVMAEIFPLPKQAVSLSLHAAAGILFAVIGLELMPEALKADVPWQVVLAFVIGGGFFVLIDKVLDIVGSRTGGVSQKSSRGAMLIFIGVSVDLFSDGIMIGAGSALDFKLALLLALGQVSADIPEGFATIANFKKTGISRKKRFLLAASFAVPVLVGAAASFLFLRGKPEIFQYIILAFTAGMLLTVAVEEMIRKAHKEKETYWGAICLVLGFAVFALISVYFE